MWINALLQRLGLPDDRYFALLSKNELEMEALSRGLVAGGFDAEYDWSAHCCSEFHDIYISSLTVLIC